MNGRRRPQFLRAICNSKPIVQSVVFPGLNRGGARRIADVESETNVFPHVIAQAGAIGMPVISPVRNLDDEAGSITVIEPLNADVAGRINRPEDLLARGQIRSS